jgi:hypothetical protein
VAVSTTIVMVCALFLESGINALTPSSMSRTAARTTAGALPAVTLVNGIATVTPAVIGSSLPARPWPSDPTIPGYAEELVSALRPLLVVVPEPELERVLVLASVTSPLDVRTVSTPTTTDDRTRITTARRSEWRKVRRAHKQRPWKNAPVVTWYGPGFYGNRTACGLRYTRYILGVAHKTLPCGTLVRVRWRGLTAVAPVIDRGPYAGPGYIFDLSAAMACRKLRPRGVDNSCYTRYDVKWQRLWRVDLRRWFQRHRRWAD